MRVHPAVFLLLALPLWLTPDTAARAVAVGFVTYAFLLAATWLARRPWTSVDIRRSTFRHLSVGTLLVLLVGALGLACAAETFSPAPEPSPRPTPVEVPPNTQGGQVVVSINIPSTVGGASTWVVSSLIETTGVSVVGSLAVGDKLTVYGTTDNSIVVSTGVAVSTITVAASGNLSFTVAPRAWLNFPFYGVVREVGTSAGRALKITGDDGAASTVVITGTVTANQGTANHDATQAWSMELTDGAGVFISPATSGAQALQLVQETAINAGLASVTALSGAGSAHAITVTSVDTAGTPIDPATEPTLANVSNNTSDIVSTLQNCISTPGAARPAEGIQVGGYSVNGTGYQQEATFPVGAAQAYGSTGAYYTPVLHGFDPTLGVVSAVSIQATNLGSAKAYSLDVSTLDASGNLLGVTAHPYRVDPTGTTTQPVAGVGVAGTPAGGVVSVQGVAGGTAQPISGSVTCSGTVAVTQSTSPWVTVDNGLAIIAGGKITGAAAATAAAPAQTGAGYLTVTNTDATQSVNIGLTGVTSSGFPLLPGQSRTVRYSDLTTVFAFIPTGVVIGWVVER